MSQGGARPRNLRRTLTKPTPRNAANCNHRRPQFLCQNTSQDRGSVFDTSNQSRSTFPNRNLTKLHGRGLIPDPRFGDAFRPWIWGRVYARRSVKYLYLGARSDLTLGTLSDPNLGSLSDPGFGVASVAHRVGKRTGSRPWVWVRFNNLN